MLIIFSSSECRQLWEVGNPQGSLLPAPVGWNTLPPPAFLYPSPLPMCPPLSTLPPSRLPPVPFTPPVSFPPLSTPPTSPSNPPKPLPLFCPSPLPCPTHPPATTPTRKRNVCFRFTVVFILPCKTCTDAPHIGYQMGIKFAVMYSVPLLIAHGSVLITYCLYLLFMA